MAGLDATAAFQAMIARYEDTGWKVRTMNHAALRATVRASVTPMNDDDRDVTIQVGMTAPRCRRIWVDSSGAVQETDVPC